MRLNAVERVYMASPLRRRAQFGYTAPLFTSWARDVSFERVLEVGHGAGRGLVWLAERFRPAVLWGVDLDADPGSLHRRGATPDSAVGAARGDAGALPLRDESVDAVVDFGALHHVPDWRGALDEVGRVLPPGGWFLFEEVSAWQLERWVARALTRHPPARFSCGDFLDALAARGFEVLPGHVERRTPRRDLVFPAGDLVGAARRT